MTSLNLSPRSLPAGFEAEAAGSPPVRISTTSPVPAAGVRLEPPAAAPAPPAPGTTGGAVAPPPRPPPPPPPPTPPSTVPPMARFFQTAVVPILIALALYLLLFHVLLPLYRKHQARYSQYLPLSTAAAAASATRSSIASALTGRLIPTSSSSSTSLRSRATNLFTRLLMPSTWEAERQQRERHALAGAGARAGAEAEAGPRSSASTDDDNNLLTDESGEALVNFDYSNNTGSIQDQNRRRRDAMERQVARGLQAAREMGMGAGEGDGDGGGRISTIRTGTGIPPERRLGRDLEEGFRDDSEDDEDADDAYDDDDDDHNIRTSNGSSHHWQGPEDGENAVTLGRGRRPPVVFVSRR